MEERTAMGKKKSEELWDIGLGGTRGNQVMCGYGEDILEWDEWIQSMLFRLRDLHTAQRRLSVFLNPPSEGQFLKDLGIDISTERIHRDCCEGIFQVAWISNRNSRYAEGRGRKILDGLERKATRLAKKQGYASYDELTA
jgi:hypothetical protein